MCVVYSGQANQTVEFLSVSGSSDLEDRDDEEPEIVPIVASGPTGNERKFDSSNLEQLPNYFMGDFRWQSQPVPPTAGTTVLHCESKAIRYDNSTGCLSRGRREQNFLHEKCSKCRGNVRNRAVLAGGHQWTFSILGRTGRARMRTKTPAVGGMTRTSGTNCPVSSPETAGMPLDYGIASRKILGRLN